MATGDKYEGEWQAGKKNGKGISLFIQVCTFLPMEISTKASSRTETGKAKVHTLGLTKVTTRESGWLTR